MIGRDRIFYDNDRLCIEIARGEGVLRGFDSPQNKQNAFLYHKAQLIELPWQGVQMIGERCCLVFYPHEMLTELPTPSFELSSSLRGNSLELLRELSHALEMAGDRLFWNIDSIPLSNFWFFGNGDILLLSNQMGDILDRFELDDERFVDKSIWHAHNCVEGFGKAHFLFQLLYYTLSGIAPFESPEVREYKFRALPLGLLFPQSCPAQPVFAIIDRAISDDKKFQFSIRRPFAFFRETLEKLSEFDMASLVTGENPGLEQYRARIKKGADRRSFFRRKGTKVTLITIAAAIVLGIAVFYVYRAVKPPKTKDLNEAQMIQWYYDAITNLDVAAMDEPLRNGYDSPDLVEVSTLYVTSSYQKAYGGQSNIINPRDWIESGMGELPEYALVYGATDVQVEQLSQDVFRAHVTFWSSENESDERNDLLVEEGMDVYKYMMVVDFTFRSRGYWREITKIENVSSDLLEQIHVDYIRPESSQVNP